MSAENIKEATLCLLVEEIPATKVLLGYKKVGFGQGKYTGFGGKVEDGESVLAAAQREMLEETGVRVSAPDLRFAARLAFRFPHKPDWSQVVYVFLANTWLGEPTESDEMIPKWFELDQIPYEEMWQDAAHWLPPVLAGRTIEAEFIFQADNESINKVTIQVEARL